ncbi:hypothetical protein JCM10207_006579 [Rhodosporidiobolus poonsookiae]
MPRGKKKEPAPEAEDDGAGLEAYQLQKAVVGRLSKAVLPQGTMLQKDVPTGLQQGSTVFVSYLSALAHDVASERNHKTINATHVLDAAKQLGWDDGDELVKILNKELKAFRAQKEAKKEGRAPPKAAKAKAPAAAAAGAEAGPSDAAAPAPEAAPVETAEGAPANGDAEAGTTVLASDGPNADEEDLFPEPEEEDLAGLEVYEEEPEDEEMDDAGSEGLEEEVVDRVGLEEDGEKAYVG